VAYITDEEAQDFARTEIDGDLPLVERALASAEVGVNQWCQRDFSEPTSATVRLFVPEPCSSVLRVDDIANTTGLVVVEDGTTLASNAYQLEVSPGEVNQTTRTGEVRPYGYVRLMDRNHWTVDGGRATVSITARWGWPTTPEPVKMATLLLARDLLKSRDVVFGVATFGADGFTRRIGENATIVALLAPYRAVEAIGVA
jgi:hypothetical protein